MAQKGLIRIAAGFLLAFGAVGGMEHTPGYLPEQLIIGLVGIALMAWAARDINRSNSDHYSRTHTSST